MSENNNTSRSRSLSVSTDEGGDTSSSVSNDDRNTTIGSASLREELFAVSTMLASLKDACPSRTNPVRLSNKSQDQSKNNIFIPKIIEYLDTIHNLNIRIIDRMDELTEENIKLKGMITDAKKPSYATIASRTTLSSGLAQSGTSTKAEVQPHLNHLGPLPADLQKISSRVDQLEQESLSCVLMIQGDSIKNVLAKAEKQPATTATAAGESSSSGERQDNKLQQSTALKRSVCDILRPIVTDVSDSCITYVAIQGAQRKHLKITCNSSSSKQHILSTLKRNKPPGLFANEYLTKIRASLLYKVRLLKKQFPSIVAAYSRNGAVFCRMINAERPFMLNDMSEVNKLEERLINGCSD